MNEDSYMNATTSIHISLSRHGSDESLDCDDDDDDDDGRDEMVNLPALLNHELPTDKPARPRMRSELEIFISEDDEFYLLRIASYGGG